MIGDRGQEPGVEVKEGLWRQEDGELSSGRPGGARIEYCATGCRSSIEGRRGRGQKEEVVLTAGFPYVINLN